MFCIPSSAHGKDLMDEYTRLINAFTRKTNQELVAMELATILLPLVLQKPPGKHTKAAVVKDLVARRMEWWKAGRLMELASEVEQIQKRLPSSGIHDREHSA